MLQVSLKSDKN